jgi:hypothetical protein
MGCTGIELAPLIKSQMLCQLSGRCIDASSLLRNLDFQKTFKLSIKNMHKMHVMKTAEKVQTRRNGDSAVT